MEPRKERFNMGRWRVQQERGQIDSNFRPPPSARTAEMKQVIPSIMKQIGIAPDFWQEKISSDWVEIVGPAVAKNTRPGKLDAVSLTVYVTNTVWLRELKQVGYKPLLEKLQGKYGAEKIRHMKLLLDPDIGENSSYWNPVRRSFPTTGKSADAKSKPK